MLSMDETGERPRGPTLRWALAAAVIAVLAAGCEDSPRQALGTYRMPYDDGTTFKVNQDIDTHSTPVGVMYDFEVGGFSIAPAFNVDFVDSEEVLVYGVNIGKGF